MKLNINFNQPVTACKQYCLAAGATQGNIAYTQTVMHNNKNEHTDNKRNNWTVSDF